MEAYESIILDLQHRLADAGITTDVFDSKLLHQFVACMWSSRRRRALAKRAAKFDGVLVLGCDPTVELVRDALGSTDCRVIRCMETDGIMNILPNVSFSFNVSIEMHGITPVEIKSH